jgi:hypothetical protein
MLPTLSAANSGGELELVPARSANLGDSTPEWLLWCPFPLLPVGRGTVRHYEMHYRYETTDYKLSNGIKLPNYFKIPASISIGTSSLVGELIRLSIC